MLNHRLAVVLAGLLLISLSISYQNYDPVEKTSENSSIVFVSTQGGIFGGKARISAINTSTKESIWTHNQFGLYYDIDIVNESSIFFVAQDPKENIENFSWENKALGVLMNWRSGEVYTRFKLPKDTHDADFIGEQKFLVADINDRAFIYDDRKKKNTWEYNFSNHFPSYPASGGIPISNYEGWTHLNDADLVMNGSAILLSPRNFNRIILVNRSSKETIFTLGSQEDTEILHRQHNPSLISTEPFTVLVANSEKNVVEEYEKTENGWNLTWSYSGDLSWPRDADRLPTGETLITDTFGHKVFQVKPNGEISWEVSVTKIPYDAEILKHENEPQGPSLERSSASVENNRDKTEHGLGFMTWYVPVWFSLRDVILFALFLGSILRLIINNRSHFNIFSNRIKNFLDNQDLY